MSRFFRTTGIWSALLMVALGVMACVRLFTRGVPEDVPTLRIMGALLEQVGTFLPFTAYAAAVSLASTRLPGKTRLLLDASIAASVTGITVFVLLTIGATLGRAHATVINLGLNASQWELHTRAAAAVFAVLAVSAGARVGDWMIERRQMAPSHTSWEPWVVALVLLVTLLGAEQTSWTLVTRYGVPTAWAVWGAMLPLPLTLVAGWTVPVMVTSRDLAAYERPSRV